MEPERKAVKFLSSISTYSNCICDACHGDGQVIKLELPETKYFDGRALRTKHHTYWLCRECRDKLVKTLEWRMDDGK